MRRLLLSFAVLFAVVLSACGGGDKSTGPGSASVSGTYTLRTINGANLPYTVFQFGADKLEVISGNVTLTDGNTYTTQSTTRETTGGVASPPQSEADAGTYTRNGTALTFRSSVDSTTVSGTVANGAITVAFEGFSAVYRK